MFRPDDPMIMKKLLPLILLLLTRVDAKEGRGSGVGNKYGLAVQIRTSEWGVSYGHGRMVPGIPF